MALLNQLLTRGVWNLNKFSRNFSQVNSGSFKSAPQPVLGVRANLNINCVEKNERGVVQELLTKGSRIPTLTDPLWLRSVVPISIGTIVPRPAVGIPVNYRINPIIYDQTWKKPMEDPTSSKIIEEAPDVARIEKQAARLIVIRRIKMNRHKLRKLRKKMKHEWGKRKLRREIRKERAFLDSKLAQIREAERFDAKAFVANIIAKAKEKEIPRRWNGKRMPAWWIREQIALGKIKF
ncbi:unnamed protein product [Allacma fusca]|uniref:Ribosomal protein mS38 C-terminal domain-containing protein n=1 Tax=Allacma fusca TaxID=39272 RepID=A0A8J2PNG7_9HEXA|nr:unnamed protein product [Allacma fusca]